MRCRFSSLLREFEFSFGKGADGSCAHLQLSLALDLSQLLPCLTMIQPAPFEPGPCCSRAVLMMTMIGWLFGARRNSDAAVAALLAPDTDTEDASVVPSSASDSDSASAASSAVLQAQAGAGVYLVHGRCQELAVEDRGLTQSFRGSFWLTFFLSELKHEELQMSRLCSLSTLSTHCSGIFPKRTTSLSHLKPSFAAAHVFLMCLRSEKTEKGRKGVGHRGLVILLARISAKKILAHESCRPLRRIRNINALRMWTLWSCKKSP